MSKKYTITVKSGGEEVYKDGENFHLSPRTEKEIKDLIILLDEKKSKLKVKLTNLEKLKKDNIEDVFGEIKVLNSMDFNNGLLNASVILGDKAQRSEELANSTLKYLSSTDIYYGTNKVVKKGEGVPYYKSVQTWASSSFIGGVSRVVFDLRPSGIYGIDFEKNLLNDGEGNYGEDFKIRIKPFFQAYK